ncbi:MAG: hypothetical protein ACHQUB_02390 [Candidatus Saccharimonadia bacterium]
MATFALVGWVSLAVIIVLLALSYKAYESHQVTTLQNQYSSLNSDVNSTDNISFRATAVAVQTSLKALDQLQSSYLDPRDVLNTVSRLLPKGVILTNIKISPTQNVVISGKANSIPEAIKLYYAITQSQTNNNNGSLAYFTGVTWSGISSDGGNAIPITVSGNYKAGSGQ